MAQSRNNYHSLNNSIHATDRAIPGGSRSQSQQELADLKQYMKIEPNLMPSSKPMQGSRLRGGHS